MNLCGSSMLPFIPTWEKKEYIRNQSYKVRNVNKMIRGKDSKTPAPRICYMKDFLKHLFKEYFESIMHVL